MRQRCIATILALGLCSNALALTYLGPPTTNMKAGQWAGGVSYADGEQDDDQGARGVGTLAHQRKIPSRRTTSASFFCCVTTTAPLSDFWYPCTASTSAFTFSGGVEGWMPWPRLKM